MGCQTLERWQPESVGCSNSGGGVGVGLRLLLRDVNWDLNDGGRVEGLSTKANVIRHTVCPHTTSNHITRYRQSSRSPATRRVYSMFRAPRRVSALSTKAVQICVALRHHERHSVTQSAHTLQAIVSHDTANHPAHQRHTAFTPARLALPSGRAPRKRTSHQDLQIRMALRHHERNSPHGLPTH